MEGRLVDISSDEDDQCVEPDVTSALISETRARIEEVTGGIIRRLRADQEEERRIREGRLTTPHASRCVPISSEELQPQRVPLGLWDMEYGAEEFQCEPMQPHHRATPSPISCPPVPGSPIRLEDERQNMLTTLDPHWTGYHKMRPVAFPHVVQPDAQKEECDYGELTDVVKWVQAIPFDPNESMGLLPEEFIDDDSLGEEGEPEGWNDPPPPPRPATPVQECVPECPRSPCLNESFGLLPDIDAADFQDDCDMEAFEKQQMRKRRWSPSREVPTYFTEEKLKEYKIPRVRRRRVAPPQEPPAAVPEVIPGPSSAVTGPAACPPSTSADVKQSVGLKKKPGATKKCPPGTVPVSIKTAAAKRTTTTQRAAAASECPPSTSTAGACPPSRSIGFKKSATFKKKTGVKKCPSGTIPASTCPPLTVPASTGPPGTIPVPTCPPGTVPVPTCRPGTVPASTCPPGFVPATTCPPGTVPVVQRTTGTLKAPGTQSGLKKPKSGLKAPGGSLCPPRTSGLQRPTGSLRAPGTSTCPPGTQPAPAAAQASACPPCPQPGPSSACQPSRLAKPSGLKRPGSGLCPPSTKAGPSGLQKPASCVPRPGSGQAVGAPGNIVDETTEIVEETRRELRTTVSKHKGSKPVPPKKKR